MYATSRACTAPCVSPEHVDETAVQRCDGRSCTVAPTVHTAAAVSHDESLRSKWRRCPPCVADFSVQTAAHLQFYSSEEAVAFCERHGYLYEVRPHSAGSALF